MPRDFKLDENLAEPIERFDAFREEVEALRYEERLAKQDPNTTVDSKSEGGEASTTGSSGPAQGVTTAKIESGSVAPKTPSA